MALIHYLYVGHFVPHDGFIRFHEGRPECEKPLDMVVLSELLQKHFGEGAKFNNISPEWGMSITLEYIVCNRDGSNQVLDLIADYAKLQAAQIVDMGSFMLLNPEDLRRSHSVQHG
jgi:hypothetical protein